MEGAIWPPHRGLGWRGFPAMVPALNKNSWNQDRKIPDPVSTPAEQTSYQGTTRTRGLRVMCKEVQRN